MPKNLIGWLYVRPGVLTDECELTIPTLSKDYLPCEYLSDIYRFIRYRGVIKVVDYHSIVDDRGLTQICDDEARKVINKVQEECNQGISAERNGELERCLEILAGPVRLSGVKW